MKSALDANLIGTPLPPEYQDVHVIASVLKSYLRDLPDPLLTFHLYNEFVGAAQRPTEAQRKSAILNAVNQLPEGHYFNLRYLTKFLSLLSKRHDRNKMSSQNIAIVMSPNLLWPPPSQAESTDYAQKVSSTTSVNTIVEMLVADWDFFFDGEVEFYITMTRDDLFPDNGGFPIERGGEMSQSMVLTTSTHNGSSPGISYMQPILHNSTNLVSNVAGNGGGGGSSSNAQQQSGLGMKSHSRSSSHDTSLILMNDGSAGFSQMKHSQSNSSLSDQSSPPQTDSPKLPVRRKHNKQAAPTPPDPGQFKVTGKKKNIEVMSESLQSVKLNLQERLQQSAAQDAVDKKPEKPPRPIMSAECQTLNRLAYKTAKSSMANVPKPVALPRTTIMKSEAGGLSGSRDGLKSSEDEEDSAVMVRDKEERLGHEKPAIPERPASLMRPNLFKGSLQEVNQPCPTDPQMVGVKKTQSFRTNSTGGLNNKDSNNNGQVLERTHIYNVDKQQVAFIDVGDGKGRGETAPLAEMESNAVVTPSEDLHMDLAQVPPSPRSITMDAKMLVKRPQVPAPPPPTNRPKSQESLGEAEITGL